MKGKGTITSYGSARHAEILEKEKREKETTAVTARRHTVH